MQHRRKRGAAARLQVHLARAILREALVRVGHRARSGKIEGLQFRDLESGASDHLVDFAVQVTTACDPRPKPRKPILPSDDAAIGSTAVFDKNQASTGLEESPCLLKRF